MKLFVAFIKLVLRIFFGILYPVRFIGRENIPQTGAFMLCANHIAARDPIILILRLGRKMMFMAKKELFKNKFVGAVIAEGGGIPVDRGHADLGAVRESIKVLESGGGLGIFPQGTRSIDNQRTPMHGGAALIKQRTGAPVIPVYIDGPYRKFRKTNIYIGEPIPLDDYKGKRDSVSIAQVTDCIDNAIWSLKDKA